MKYKKGDKVRVRQWKAMEREFGENLEYGLILTPLHFTIEMSNYCGKVVTISEVWNDYYRIKEDNGASMWTDDMFEGYAFEYGEEVEFSNDELRWKRGIYVGYIDGTAFPYKAVHPSDVDSFKAGEVYSNVGWKYARPIKKRHTITIDNHTIEISEESYQNLKKALLALDGGQEDDGDTTNHS